MNIGLFSTKDNGTIAGEIVAIGAQIADVAFEAITKTGNSPDYIITANGGELGAAWKKTSKEGNTYLSVSLKSPFLPAPVNCALVQSQQNPGQWALRWSEPRPNGTEV